MRGAVLRARRWDARDRSLWWAPLRSDRRVWRRNAMVAVLDKSSEFAGRAVHEWSANVFRDDAGPGRSLVETPVAPATEALSTLSPALADQLADLATASRSTVPVARSRRARRARSRSA